MRAALVFFVLAAIAFGQDEIYETVWIVGEDGSLLGWPDPDTCDRVGEIAFKPFTVFGPTPGGVFEYMCPWAMALLVVPGPTELASLCDPERHLRKTNQITWDEYLLSFTTPEWIAASRTDRSLRRPFLDMLLGWRVLESRGVRDAADALKGVVKAKEAVDPITRLAAGDIAATLEGKKLPAIELPPLDGIPADAGVLVVVDQRRIPPWRDYWRLHHTWGVREFRQAFEGLAPFLAPADLCDAQWIMDRECEAFYELARRFGNARIHRTVLAVRFPADADDMSRAKVFLRCEGLFEPDLFKDGCVAFGVKPRETKSEVAALFGDVDVTVAPDRLLVSRNYPVPAAGGGIPPELAKLGLGGDDAIFIRCRKVPFADSLPVKGIESLTLRAKFEGGVTVHVEATFKDEALARAAEGEILRWKTLDLKPVKLREANPKAIVPLKAFLDSLTAKADGTTVVAQASAPGAAPESLFAAVIELDALYAEEVAEPLEEALREEVPEDK